MSGYSRVFADIFKKQANTYLYRSETPMYRGFAHR
jgi:hypothetical protein